MGTNHQSKHGVCNVDGCDQTNIAAKGMCWKHYRRMLRHGSVHHTKIGVSYDKTCSVEGCERKHKAHGYCDKHSRRFKTTGIAIAPDINRWDGRLSTLPEHVIEDTQTGCWLWEDPYSPGEVIETFHSPRVNLEGQLVYVHRVIARELMCGKEPGLISRECGSKHCVNPDHLKIRPNTSSVEERVTVSPNINRNKVQQDDLMQIHERRKQRWRRITEPPRSANG